jgi:hypothetical protein
MRGGVGRRQRRRASSARQGDGAAARYGHAAVLLETGVVMLAGGYGSDGSALSSIEIYTPGP